MYVKFAELPVFDQERAIAFYTANLSFEVARDAAYGKDGWRWVELKPPRGETHVLLARRPDDRPSDRPAMVLVEPDVVQLIERLKSANVEIITEPREAPWEPGRLFAELRDSEGNRITVGSA